MKRSGCCISQATRQGRPEKSSEKTVANCEEGIKKRGGKEEVNLLKCFSHIRDVFLKEKAHRSNAMSLL